MKINYKETASDLQTRINIHNQFGGRNIDQWMLEILNLQKKDKILDVGCGAGKQCFSFYNYLDGDTTITGGDVSDELLAQAKQKNKETKDSIEFIPLDFNEVFPFEDNQFDLVSCCFAIYYAKDIPFTIKEINRVLKPGGRFFSTGPMPENKKVFYDIIHEATNTEIPPMPGSSRYSTEILSELKSVFSAVKTEIFENPLTFKTAEPFIDYTKASLSEDRKLWKDMFSGEKDFKAVMDKISQVAEDYVKQNGNIIMTKVVGGFIATK